MKVLIINKFLYPNGGSETYIFKLRRRMTARGTARFEHPVWSMKRAAWATELTAYTSGMDFHGGSKLSKLTSTIETIYSKEAWAAEKVLDDFAGCLSSEQF